MGDVEEPLTSVIVSKNMVFRVPVGSLITIGTRMSREGEFFYVEELSSLKDFPELAVCKLRSERGPLVVLASFIQSLVDGGYLVEADPIEGLAMLNDANLSTP